MLKCNPKVWAIVLVVCLIAQFLITSIPVWIEEREQAAIAAEAEQLAAKEEIGNGSNEKAENSESSKNVGTIGVEKTQENGNAVNETENTDEEGCDSVLFMFLLLVVVVFFIAPILSV